MRNRLLPAILAAIMLAPVFFMHSCANTTEAPTGGDKDTIPPYIIGIKPAPSTANVPVKGSKFEFIFNEYVTVKNGQNILLSPPQQKRPKYKVQGKSVIVSFEEDLKPNTTYTISFTDAIVDANESNPFPGYTYAFSTGEKVDSMLITGVVQDCIKLEPFKGATVLLYKDLADSAVFLHRPDAIARTDAWGFFALPYIKDTCYRLYALKDASNNNIYDPDNDLIAFVDSIIRPVMVVRDSIPEMTNYEMADTARCLARKQEYELNLFREKPSKQFLNNKVRTADRSAYITFMAPNAWIDTLWVRGYKNEEIISEFNIMQDSLLIWLNSRKRAPDTLHVFVNYRKTDSLGILKPELEHLKLVQEGKKPSSRRSSYQERKNLKHEDTICVMKLSAAPETVEQYGFDLHFNFPIISEKFDSVTLKSISPRQKETFEKFKVETDSLDLRHYIIKPDFKMMSGYEYILKVPHRAFRDVNGFYSDSAEVKVSLPTSEKLSSLTLNLEGVDRKLIVDLLDEKAKVLRNFIVEKDCSLLFPYLQNGKVSIRITEDGNRNTIVDTGSVLEHRQPEKVVFVKFKDDKYLLIPESSDIEQNINVKELL
ncbi:MAG: Ig-like domain-containing protein [Bacteroidales bacterium]|nr:Ig-like domain-containing protein [Candidatus Cryptobacteroides equifaecalis]